MNDLVAFLRARLDADEAIARDAMSPASGRSGRWAYGDPQIVCDGDWVIESARPGPGRHAARHDPARVLADVDAKRRILDRHPLTDQIINPGYGKHVADFGCTTCHDWDGVTEGRGYCQTLRLLALPHAGHSDYQPDWAPDA